MASDAPFGLTSLACEGRSVAGGWRSWMVRFAARLRSFGARSNRPALWREGDIGRSRDGECQAVVWQGVSKHHRPPGSNRGWPLAGCTRGFVRLARRPVHVTKASSYKATTGGQTGERHGVTHNSDGQSTRARALRPGGSPGPSLKRRGRWNLTGDFGCARTMMPSG